MDRKRKTQRDTREGRATKYAGDGKDEKYIRRDTREGERRRETRDTIFDKEEPNTTTTCSMQIIHYPNPNPPQAPIHPQPQPPQSTVSRGSEGGRPHRGSGNRWNILHNRQPLSGSWRGLHKAQRRKPNNYYDIPHPHPNPLFILKPHIPKRDSVQRLGKEVGHTGGIRQ